MKKIPQAESLFVFLLIAVNMVIGIVTLPGYGESWDEARLYEYGEQAINAYRALFDPNLPVDFGDDDLRYYGPAYFMGMSLMVRIAQNVFPQTPVIDLWHIGNFACLQIGILCFHLLLRRFIGAMPALATTILFALQPLIRGHGFINPKDIPFMTFFTVSILLGLKMVERYQEDNFEIRTLIKNPWFFTAAIALGLTISLRVLGFYAGLIVLFHFVFVNVHKALRLSYAYFGSALLVSFLTWPYLWSSPIANFIKGIYAMLKFQWVGQVLFNGMYYSSNQLPSEYVPRLLLMQLTEPALALFVIGMMGIVHPHLRQKYKGMGILFLPWFAVPLLYILTIGMNLYDNTRQLLFILPGAFLIIAIGLDVLFARIRPWQIQTLLLVLIVFPGVAGNLKYHPYEYTYYNLSATSGQQIFRNYETDYWATSFKQASAYLNDTAPENALVIVWGPAQLIRRYARQDIQVKSFDDLKGTDYAAHPYYLVLTTRYDKDLAIFPDIQPIYSVRRNDSVLAVIKYITP